jgi:glycosyltransferase involved in cell wall biosynthesis
LNDYATVNGGASKVAITTANGLAERGYQVFYFAGVGPVNPDLYRSKNIHVICLDQFDILGDPIPLRAAFTGIWNSRAVQEFKKLSQELDLKNTIVNLHSWTKNLTASIVRQCIQKDISTVVTLHDYFLACPNGGFYNFQKVKPCPLIGLSIACLFEDCDQRNYSHKLWRFTRQLAQKKLGRLPDGLKNFIALSDFSLRILQPYLPEKCNLWQVYNPIEITKQPPVDVEKNNTFIVLGRLAPEKGSYFFTRAAKQAGVEILLVGDGPERATIENEYSSENITGWLPHHEAIDKLNQARVHVLPSLCYEVSPLAVYEAAAKGVPSIVPTTSAACKFIKDGETGLLFTGGDEHSLVEKILRFTKPGEAQRMGLSAYNTYWKNPCSIESYLEKLENIFSEILKQT